MSFGEAIKSVFSNYATFSGRARRSEYWYFFLFNLIVGIVLFLIDSVIFEEKPILSTIYSLAVLIPGLAVAVRRLHDIGKSGWSYLIPLIPYVLLIIIIIIAFVSGSDASNAILFITILLGLITLALSIMLIIWLCRDSQPGVNKWGPNPKEMPNSDPAATVY